MARTSRSVAGRKVMALARTLSDELLAQEEAAFANVEAEWLAGQGNAESRVRAVLPRGTLRALTSGDVTKAVRKPAETAGQAVLAVCTDLFTLALDMTGTAIKAELLICESTLAPKFAGITGEADSVQHATAPPMLKVMADQMATVIDGAVTDMVAQAERQVRLAVSADKGDPERAVLRLFSTQPLRAAGLPGRGVWWWPAVVFKRDMRAIEFGGVNGLRTGAMLAFNQAGKSR